VSKESEDFAQYRLLILSHLELLRKDQKELFTFLQNHMDEENENLQEIRERLIRLETDRMYWTKMWSAGVASIVSLLVGIIIRFMAP